jgi:hypothetical protein
MPAGPAPITSTSKRRCESLFVILYFSVFTSMPASHKIWQLRQCGVPLIDTRHSKQIPIPHNGPRGSPLTDLRQVCPAIATATATVAPASTATGEPFTFNVTVPDLESGMRNFLHRP